MQRTGRIRRRKRQKKQGASGGWGRRAWTTAAEADAGSGKQNDEDDICGASRTDRWGGDTARWNHPKQTGAARPSAPRPSRLFLFSVVERRDIGAVPIRVCLRTALHRKRGEPPTGACRTAAAPRAGETERPRALAGQQSRPVIVKIASQPCRVASFAARQQPGAAGRRLA